MSESWQRIQLDEKNSKSSSTKFSTTKDEILTPPKAPPNTPITPTTTNSLENEFESMVSNFRRTSNNRSPKQSKEDLEEYPWLNVDNIVGPDLTEDQEDELVKLVSPNTTPSKKQNSSPNLHQHNNQNSENFQPTTPSSKIPPKQSPVSPKYNFPTLIEACKKGDLNLVKLILKKSKQLLNQRDEYLFNPLITAAKYGQEPIVRLLLQSGAEINGQTNKGFTALLSAIHQNHYNITNLLLNFGADMRPNNLGYTPLLTASRFGFAQLAELLLKFGANTEEAEISGFTPLLTACKEGHKEVVRLLIKNGADINHKNKIGFTPIITAARQAQADILKLLIEEGAEINTFNSEGFNALLSACKEEQTEIVSILLKAGADLNAINTITGFTALHSCALTGNERIMKLLLEYKPTCYLAKNQRGETALEVAFKHRHFGIVKMLDDYDIQFQKEREEKEKQRKDHQNEITPTTTFQPPTSPSTPPPPSSSGDNKVSESKQQQQQQQQMPSTNQNTTIATPQQKQHKTPPHNTIFPSQTQVKPQTQTQPQSQNQSQAMEQIQRQTSQMQSLIVHNNPQTANTNRNTKTTLNVYQDFRQSDPPPIQQIQQPHSSRVSKTLFSDENLIAKQQQSIKQIQNQNQNQQRIPFQTSKRQTNNTAINTANQQQQPSQQQPTTKPYLNQSQQNQQPRYKPRQQRSVENPQEKENNMRFISKSMEQHLNPRSNNVGNTQPTNVKTISVRQNEETQQEQTQQTQQRPKMRLDINASVDLDQIQDVQILQQLIALINKQNQN